MELRGPEVEALRHYQPPREADLASPNRKNLTLHTLAGGRKNIFLPSNSPTNGKLPHLANKKP